MGRWAFRILSVAEPLPQAVVTAFGSLNSEKSAMMVATTASVEMPALQIASV